MKTGPFGNPILPLDAFVVSCPTYTKNLEWYLTYMYLSNNENPTYQRAGLAKFSTPFLKVPFCGGILNVDLKQA